MTQRAIIDFPGVNGCAVCDCGSVQFRVGIDIDAVGNNHIRCLECVRCGDKLAVPFFKDLARAE